MYSISRSHMYTCTHLVRVSRLLYLFHVIALAVRHPRTSGTESTNGWHGVGIHRLGKSDPRVTEPRMEVRESPFVGSALGS